MMTKNDHPEETETHGAEGVVLKCSSCNRELEFSNRYVGDQDDILCETCYKSMAFPYSGNCRMEELH